MTLPLPPVERGATDDRRRDDGQQVGGAEGVGRGAVLAGVQQARGGAGEAARRQDADLDRSVRMPEKRAALGFAPVASVALPAGVQARTT